MDLNVVLSNLGNFGKFQAFQYLLALLPNLIGGVAILSPVFLLGEPKQRCFIDECDVQGAFQSFDGDWINYGIPMTGSNLIDGCSRFVQTNRSDFCDVKNFGNTTQLCEKYVYEQNDFVSTVVTKFNIVCDHQWKVPLAKSIMLASVFFASIVFGRLADMFGRKRSFYWAPLVAVLASAGGTYAPNYMVFTALLAIRTFCLSGMMLDSFVLGMELVGDKYRTICGNGLQIAFAFGTLILAALAYFIRETTQLQLALTAVFALLLPMPWLLEESIRWNVSKGRGKEALKTIQNAAATNGISLNDDVGRSLLKITENAQTGESKCTEEGLLTAIKQPLLRRWLVNLFFCWMINALVYYSLSLQASTLSKDTSVYVGFALLAVVEIPFIFLISFSMDKLGRKFCLVTALVAAGACCLLAACIPATSLYAGVAGKGFISASFSLIYVYTAEIYPTNIRSSIIGACSTMSRIGSVSAPHVARLAVFSASAPLLFCGAMSVLSGTLALDLPETRNRPLVDTLADAQNLKKSTKKLVSEAC